MNEGSEGNEFKGDIIIRLIKEASGLEGKIADCKITLKMESALNFSFRKLLKLKHTNMKDDSDTRGN